MDRTSFKSQLTKCSKMAACFARNFILDKITDEFLYDVEIQTAPGYLENPYFVAEMDEDSVCSILWKDGKVPEWIDIYVKRRKGSYTVLELDCSCRFEESPSKLFNRWNNTEPFEVKSPVFPFGWNCSHGKFRLCPTLFTCLLDIVMFRWRVIRYAGVNGSVRVQLAQQGIAADGDESVRWDKLHRGVEQR